MLQVKQLLGFDYDSDFTQFDSWFNQNNEDNNIKENSKQEDNNLKQEENSKQGNLED